MHTCNCIYDIIICRGEYGIIITKLFCHLACLYQEWIEGTDGDS